jgi:hypothetical protein
VIFCGEIIAIGKEQKPHEVSSKLLHINLALIGDDDQVEFLILVAQKEVLGQSASSARHQLLVLLGSRGSSMADSGKGNAELCKLGLSLSDLFIVTCHDWAQKCE